MDYLTNWITNIILFILLAIIVDLLLPNTNLQRYAKMVIGLLLIVIILTPVLNIFNQDVDDLMSFIHQNGDHTEKEVEILIENKKKEIQASQRAYILEQMAVQMENQVKERLDSEHGLEVNDIYLKFANSNEELNLQNLQEVEIMLKPKTQKSEDSVEAIQPVVINTQHPLPEKEAVEKGFSKDVLHFLANEWQLPNEKIVIVVEGGEM